jgi:hypothetical protein
VICSCLPSYRPLSDEVPVGGPDDVVGKCVEEDIAEVGRGDEVEGVGEECVCRGGHCCCVG